jgi:hypothetical protein
MPACARYISPTRNGPSSSRSSHLPPARDYRALTAGGPRLPPLTARLLSICTCQEGARRATTRSASPRRGKGPRGCSSWTAMDSRWTPAGLPTPAGFHLDSAGCAEVRLAEQTLDTITVMRPHGRPRGRPEQLVADRRYDRGYDSSAFRRALRHRGIGRCVPAKRRPKGWRPKRGRPGPAGAGMGRGVAAPLYRGAQLRLARQLPARAHPLGTPERHLAASIGAASRAASLSPCCWSACGGHVRLVQGLVQGIAAQERAEPLSASGACAKEKGNRP